MCYCYLMFEKFRHNSLKNCGLCPSHYLSALALSWDAMLNRTKVELITDLDMYIFFENSTYLKSYDPKQESKHIVYLDANNLSGYAISKFLPTRGFKWIDKKN